MSRPVPERGSPEGRCYLPDRIARTVVSARAYGEWEQLGRDLAWARTNMPVGIVDAPGYDPFWLVSKHADIQEIGRQPLVFSNNGHRAALISKLGEQAMIAAASAADAPPTLHALVVMDPPVHAAYRKLAFADFAPKGIKGLEDDIRVLARESIGEMAGLNGRCDFSRDVALRYPMRVILSILGVPRSEEDRMLRLTQEYFNPQDPDLNQTGVIVSDAEAMPTAHETLEAYYDYFNALTGDRRQFPTSDIASAIANSRLNGKLIDHWSATSYYITILTAGHDTTSSSTAAGIWALAQYPEQFARVKADRSLIPGLVDEAIRWATPVNHFMRTATRDYVLRDQRIAAGDWLMLSYPSANRDEDVFEAPNEFRVDRPRNQQISFGSGAHVCLGQHLARMEMRIFFEELLERLETVELSGPVTRNHSVFVGGIKAVPINFAFS